MDANCELTTLENAAHWFAMYKTQREQNAELLSALIDGWKPRVEDYMVRFQAGRKAADVAYDFVMQRTGNCSWASEVYTACVQAAEEE